MSHGTICLGCRRYVAPPGTTRTPEDAWCACAEPQPSTDGRTACRHTHIGSKEGVTLCLLCGVTLPEGYQPQPEERPEPAEAPSRRQHKRNLYGTGRLVYPPLKMTWQDRYFEVQADGAVYERRPQAESSAAKRRRLLRDGGDKPLDGRPAMLGPLRRIKDIELAEAVRDRARAIYREKKAAEAAITGKESPDA